MTRRREGSVVGRSLFVVLAVGLVCSEGWCQQGSDPSGAASKKKISVAPTTQRTGQADAQSRPNVVWIVLDACRAQNLSCYGYDRPTSPNLDALAKEGVLFEEMHSQAFWTPPSVSSYMSGQLFPRLALFRNAAVRERVLTPRMGAVLLPKTFEENGYHTCLVSAHAGYIRDGCPLWDAFSERILLAPAARADTSTGEASVSFERVCSVVLPWLDKPHDSPFFLYIHAMDTHFPHTLSGDEFTQWLPNPYTGTAIKNGQPVVQPGDFREEGFFDEEDKAYMLGLYDGSIRYADKYVGYIIDKLKQMKQFENTFVIVTSDHGEILGEPGNYWGHGDNLDSEELTHVPCIMSVPGIEGGRRVPCMSQLVDIYPTLVDALGLRTTAVLHGRSLYPALTHPSRADAKHQMAVSVGKFSGDGQPRLYAQNKEFRFSWELASQEEHLWKRPDKIGNRTDALNSLPEIAGNMKANLEASVLPLYQQATRDPGEVVLTGYITEGTLSPPDAFVNPGDKVGGEVHTDNKWCFSSKGNTIWANGASEDCPPITLTLKVPNGAFRIVLELLQDADHSGTGFPASTMMARLPGEQEFRNITTGLPAPGTQRSYILLPIGVCKVDDHQFVLTLDDVRGNFCYLRQVFLVSEQVPVETAIAEIEKTRQEGKQPTAEESKSQQEALKALGYLN